jgi:hypothetical protein
LVAIFGSLGADDEAAWTASGVMVSGWLMLMTRATWVIRRKSAVGDLGDGVRRFGMVGVGGVER